MSGSKLAAVVMIGFITLTPALLLAEMSPEDLLTQVREWQRDFGGDRIGLDKNGRVVKLQLSNVLASHEAVIAASHLPNLEDLTCACPLGVTNRITAAAIRSLSGLTNLHDLTLRFPLPVMSKEYVAAIATLTNLTALRIEFSKIESPESLSLLSSLSGLRILSFGSSHDFDDARLEHLPILSRLEELKLSGTQITDASLAHIREFQNLKRLDLRNTRITTEGLRDAQLSKTIKISRN